MSDEKELRELRKQVKELRKSQAKVTLATVEDLKKEIARHSAGEKALESQRKRMEALEKARAVRAGPDAKKKEEAPKKEKKVEKPIAVVKAKKEKVEKPAEKAEVLAKNVRRRVVKDGDE